MLLARNGTRKKYKSAPDKNTISTCDKSASPADLFLPSGGEPDGDAGRSAEGRHEDGQEHLHLQPGTLRPPLRRHHPLHHH